MCQIKIKFGRFYCEVLTILGRDCLKKSHLIQLKCIVLGVDSQIKTYQCFIFEQGLKLSLRLVSVLTISKDHVSFLYFYGLAVSNF